ncbi:MAG: CHASE2 domain-containing protein, partial [Chloroflexi bacterium]|nr:CHASE2 domain-containing protein [Chloroflexota bacterium]
MKVSGPATRSPLDWKPFRSLVRVRASGLAFTVALLGLLSLLRVFETVELNAVNAAFNLRGPRQPGAPIAIVAVDQESFDQTHLQWPWPRDYLARIVDNIAAGGPKVIVLDVCFYEEDQRAGGDAQLAEA